VTSLWAAQSVQAIVEIASAARNNRAVRTMLSSPWLLKSFPYNYKCATRDIPAPSIAYRTRASDSDVAASSDSSAWENRYWPDRFSSSWNAR
jgi:hypothetical protein